MKKSLLIITLFTVCACASHTGVVVIDKDTFMIAKQQATGFPGLGNMKAEIIAEGSQYCADLSKEFQIVSTQETKPPYILGNYPRSEIQFMCIDSDNKVISKNALVAKTTSNTDPSKTQITKITPKEGVRLIPNFHSAPRPNDIAVVIGIENYQNIRQNSDYSYEDAQLVKDYLMALGFLARNIEYLTNERATGTGIKKAFEAWLPNHIKDNSKVFVYYSGHGAPDTKGNGYIVPYDGDPNYLDITGYPLDILYANLEKLEADEVILVIDSCFSGAGGKSVLPKGARPISIEVKSPILLSDKVAVLSSSGMNQISTAYPDKELGLFTYHFLKALKDGKMTLFDIYNYIEPMVEDEAKKMNIEQTPQLILDMSKAGSSFSIR